jgi:glutathione synthase
MIKVGVVMDPIGGIKVNKDSTLAMLLAAQSRYWQLFYIEQSDLYLENGQAHARMRQLTVEDDEQHWYELHNDHDAPLHHLDVILMRKDPPFNAEYLYSTYILELAQREGVLVINDPRSLRDANEKLFTAWFPQCCPETLVSRNISRLRDFLDKQQDIILKPLDLMGGASIFRIQQNDPNASVILETITEQQNRMVMAQRFIPEISAGDKRILLVDGQPIPYALARIPAKGETRGNLAAGGAAEGVELTERDYWICEQVAPVMQEKGLLFVGLDVIGDYLTEINITSPTCIRELDRLYDMDIAGKLMDAIEKLLEQE